MIKTLSLMTDVLPDRQVVVVAPIPDQHTHKLSDLLHSEFFGMWRDREDITDSALFARQLREETWRRSDHQSTNPLIHQSTNPPLTNPPITHSPTFLLKQMPL